MSSAGQQLEIAVVPDRWRQADALLTRDRGFYRSQFEGLAVREPARSDE
jgi:hypothetical protein